MTGPMALLRSRRMWPLNLTQSCGAFNDNLVKNAMVVFAVFAIADAGGGGAGVGLTALAGALFIVPYIFLSATAGQIADRVEKSGLVRVLKGAEIVLMAAAGIGFLTESIPMLLAVLFGLGAQAAMFGPVKYAILPDHLAEEELVAGNGLIEAGNFLAIVTGTVAGGALVTMRGGPGIVAAAGLAVSIMGFAAAWAVPRAMAGDPSLRIGKNIIREMFAVVRGASENRPVWLAVLGLSWFWAVGATLLAEFPTLTRDVLAADAHVLTLLLTVFAVGIGAGSILCASLLKGEVSARYVPFAAVGISLFCWDFATAASHGAGLASVPVLLQSFAGWRMMLDLLCLATCGGLYSVPLYAVMQESSAPSHRARMIAANNIVNALFIVVGAGLVAGLDAAGVSAPTALKLMAAANFAVAVWIVRVLPQVTFRALFQWYFRLFHRVAVHGLELLKDAGPRSVVVINHISFLDGCFVAAFLPGDIVFAVDREQARRFWFLRYLIDIFPVDSASPMSTKSMVRAVKDGRRLGIFPEGRITRTGTLMKIYDGPGMIADHADAVIIPVKIDGLQFHRTSRMAGRLPLRWFPRLSMTVLPPRKLAVAAGLTGRARREALGRAVQDLMVDAAFRPDWADKSLFAGLLDARDRFDMGMPVVADVLPNDTGGTTITEIGYRRLLLGAVVLGRKLAKLTVAGERVGVLLPNSVGTVVTFFALQSQARVVAMMNFTTGADAMLACCRAADIRTILTSRRAVERAKLDGLVAAVSAAVRFVYLEDVRASIGVWDRLTGLLASRRTRRLPGARSAGAAEAVVLFTSGSEGAPKGVVLSHLALLSNCAQVATVVDFNPIDRVFNALPMFHSFGLTGGTLLPLMNGVRTFLYPSPLHYKIVPEMIYFEQSTIMFGTDSFLSGYARRGHAVDLQSLRYIFAGAERVRPETRAIYMSHFKKPIFEGYGATETGPVLALNTWAHSREGSVGRLLPGIAWRVEPVAGIAEGGRLRVKGPNVMLGYLRAERPGVLEAPEGGWYDTGDIVTIDDKGFVTIRGRAKRFAKIAGEMVSLTAAEALAGVVWPQAANAVVAVADARKGERLVLVTTQADAAPAALLAAARARQIAEIMVPREVLTVSTLPLLGTGKVNYPEIMRIVESMKAEVAGG